MLAEGLFGDRINPWLWYRSQADYWYFVFRDHSWMIAWTTLAGGLLFAALLIFRTLGYRLVRTIQIAPPVKSNAAEPELVAAHEYSI
jgi:hypothetical protein